MKNNKALYFVNFFTITRIIGTLILPFLTDLLTPIALIIYITLLLLTDAIDGFLARKLKACTIFGSLLDQIADKLLLISVLAILAMKYPIMLLPILTEIIIVVINSAAAVRGTSAQSSILGKIKTWALGISVVVGLCAIYAKDIIQIIKINNISKALSYLNEQQSMVIVAVALISLGTGLMVAADYFVNAKNEIKEAKETGIIPENFKLKKGQDLKEVLFSYEYYLKTKDEPLIVKLCEKDYQ